MRFLTLGLQLLSAATLAQTGAPEAHQTRHGDVDKFANDLRPLLSKGAKVSLPDSASWDDLVIRASTPRITPDFVVAVEPLTENDISNTIKVANKFGFPFLTVAGTHGWPTSMLKMKDGVQINMRRMNSTTISKNGKTATAGGGVMQYQITEALAQHNKQAVTGICECVSTIGPALGGGHSMLQYEHGFAADNLVSARVVLHDGRIVTASKKENADLWWAIQGAGHNFGVVATFETKLYDISKEPWQMTNLAFTQDKLEKFLETWNGLEKDFPDAGLIVLQGVLRRVDEVDPDHPCINLQIISHGKSKAAEYARRFRALSPATEETFDSIAWSELFDIGGFGLESPVCRKNENIMGFPNSYSSWDPAAMREGYKIFDELVSDPVFSTSAWLLESYGMKGVHAVPDDANAVAPEERRYQLLTSPMLWWQGDDQSDREKAIDRGRRIQHAVRSTTLLPHSYVNYAYGNEEVGETYGRDEERLAKLRKLKKQWDPKNKFGFYNPIQ